MATAGLTSVCALLGMVGVNAFMPPLGSLLKSTSAQRGFLHQEHTSTCLPIRMSTEETAESRRDFVRESAVGIAAGAIAATASTGVSSPAEAASVSAWEQIELPVASVLYDIAFDPEHPDHGLVVGAQGTFLEVGRTSSVGAMSHPDSACKSFALSMHSLF